MYEKRTIVIIQNLVVVIGKFSERNFDFLHFVVGILGTHQIEL